MTSLSTKFYASQLPGKRDYQEDDYGLLDARVSGRENAEHTVIVVADGMGGHVGGDQASGLATEHFIEAYQGASGTIPERLEQALKAANSALTAAITGNAELKGMGSTLVAVVINEARLYWISVGDSPLWLFRNNALQRLNADHSMAPVLQQMVADGRISQEQADSDPGRHSLLSVLMGEAIEMIDLRSEAFPLEDGDLVLLSSDGLLTLTVEQITGILTGSAGQPVATLVKNLHKAVEDVAYPNQDNITITLYRANSQAQLTPLRALTEPRTAQLATSTSDSSFPNSYFRLLLLPVCFILIILASFLFRRLNSDDSTTPVPVTVPAIPVPVAPADAVAEVAPLTEPAQPAKPEPIAVQNGQEVPVIEKQPEGTVAPVPEQDGLPNEKTQ